MKTKNNNPKTRKRSKQYRDSLGMPESVINEIRGIRNDSEEIDEKRDGDHLSYSCTYHATSCETCGAMGDHICLPLLHDALENCEEYAEIAWKAYLTFKEHGYFVEQSDVSRISLLQQFEQSL